MLWFLQKVSKDFPARLGLVGAGMKTQLSDQNSHNLSLQSEFAAIASAAHLNYYHTRCVTFRPELHDSHVSAPVQLQSALKPWQHPDSSH
jgi:hypothetical protein